MYDEKLLARLWASYSVGRPELLSKRDFLNEALFGYTTKSEVDDRIFLRRSLLAVEAITERTQTLLGSEDLAWFDDFCALPFFCERLDWGSDKRKAWWGTKTGAPITFEIKNPPSHCAASNEVHYLSASVWKEFMRALLRFASDVDVREGASS